MSDDYERHNSTYEAMLAVLREIGVIAKSRQTNSKNEDFKFAFRGIEELLEVVNPLCKKHGLLTPPVMTGPPIVSEYPTRNSTMHWVMVPVAIHFRAPDADDVIVAGPFLGEAADAGDKAATKAQSVAWREIMFKTFNVPTRGDDYDTEATPGEDTAAASQAEIEAAEREAAETEAKERGWESLSDLTEAWDYVKKWGASGGEAAEWMKVWCKGWTLRTLTAERVHELEVVLANAKKDGNWKANYTPPEPEVEGE